MSTQAYFSDPKTLRRLHQGPLGPHIDAFAARLLAEGHSWQSAWRNFHVVSEFSGWLARKGIGLGELNEDVLGQYQRYRLRYRRPYLSDRAALTRLLVVLRDAGAIAAAPVSSMGPLARISHRAQFFGQVTP